MRIGIIGTGIIASAIVTGFCTGKTGHEFFLSPRNAEKAAALAAKFSGVTVCASNQDVVNKAEWVFICLLKKDFSVLGELDFSGKHKVVNISADMRLPDLRDMIGETALLAHVIPLPFIADGFGPVLVYPELKEVGEIFSSVGSVHFTAKQSDVQTLQIVTGLMSAYNMLLSEIVMYSDQHGIEHDASVKFLCSLFNALCTRAANIYNCDLVELAHEMTPGGYNEQAMKELLGNGAIGAWRTALNGLHERMHGDGSEAGGMVVMETERLILRDYKETDLKEMHRLWSDKETMYFLDDIWCSSIDDTTKYLKIGLANSDGHYFCICEKGKDIFIGSIGYTITGVTPVGKIVHMGYMLFPEFSGRGYITEAAKKVIEYAFTKDDCIRITTGCYKEHEASRKVMEKAGFRKEGEKLKAQYHDGIMKDRLDYAINKYDFLNSLV